MIGGFEFLRGARLLLIQESDEACERSAISRAYYAAFHEARFYCGAHGQVVTVNNTHLELRRRLEQLGEDQIALDLRELHDMRKTADYDLEARMNDSSAIAISAVSLAESIVDRLGGPRS